MFKSALKGLISVTDLSLIQLGEFCSKISEASLPARGLPIRNAIGWSLPHVGLPRDSSFFASAKTYGQAIGPWRKAFEKLLTQRAPLLAKQRSNGQPIDPEEMHQRLIENSESIDAAAQPTLEAFINAPMGDDSITWDVAQLEWEEHGVHFIFEKPRERQQGLANSTIYFFEHDCADSEVLAEGWRKHLEDLKRVSAVQTGTTRTKSSSSSIAATSNKIPSYMPAGKRSSLASRSSARTSLKAS
ncbi:MAG: hypothetical protein IPG34_12575 [Rhodocyclaceae bacterium]|nr:hypothetical protein [Rhodocyclaceae bacterium]